MVPATLPERQERGPSPAAGGNARAKWRVAAMDARPDMQPVYDSSDEQDHGSPPPRDQQTYFGEV